MGKKNKSDAQARLELLEQLTKLTRAVAQVLLALAVCLALLLG